MGERKKTITVFLTTAMVIAFLYSPIEIRLECKNAFHTNHAFEVFGSKFVCCALTCE